MTIEELRNSGMIAYEYIRGSHAYGLNTPTSDEDHGGVFICPKEMLYGLRGKYIEQVSDEKGDTVFYEFGRWVELLLKSNPTALESLFIPKRCIVGEVHPMVQAIIDNREMFLSKECFKTLTGYAVSQIGKARGLNKKIVNPVTQRKDVLDFCYTFKDQGSQPMKEWLEEHHLDQKYCGLVNIPNMANTYGVYYDFAAHFKFEELDKGTYDDLFADGEELTETNFDEWCFDMRFRTPRYDVLLTYDDVVKAYDRVVNKNFFKYKGIVHPDVEVKMEDGTSQIIRNAEFDEQTKEMKESNDVRLSSIPKGEKPICTMTYNKDGYQVHCREYKEYKDWEENRNPERYKSNLNQNYDGKNMCHCMRLTRMGKELALGQGFNVERTYDREYLLSIKNHELEYDEIMAQANKEKAEMEAAIENCTLPDKPDYDKVNEVLIKARMDFYK